MTKFDLEDLARMSEIFKKKDKKSSIILWVLAIVGAIAAGCAIAYAIYRYMTPDYLEDYEDEFEDDYEDDFDDEDEEEDIFEDEEEN